jgi:peptidoglycan/LPS O-acetylase OafA/YrhL
VHYIQKQAQEDYFAGRIAFSLKTFPGQAWNYALAFSLYWVWALLVVIPFSALSYLLVEKPGVTLGEKLWYKKDSKSSTRERYSLVGPLIAIPDHRKSA